MNNSCANCKNLKTLWWWVYKDDGHIDHKEYGKCCVLLLDEDVVLKLDDLNGMCECFAPYDDNRLEQ